MNLHTADFEQTLDANRDRLIVLDFYADWCGPCKMLAPHLAAAEGDYPDVFFAKVNVDEEEALARRFSIVSIPTLLFIKNGVAVKKSVGYLDADELRALIDSAL